MNVTTDSEKIEVNQGDNVTLTCLYDTMNSSHVSVKRLKTTKLVNGKPDPINSSTQLWNYDTSVSADKQIHETIKLTSPLLERNFDIPASSGHSITIKNISMQDEGIYVCQLELEFGNKEGTAYTKVDFKSE